MQPTLTPVISDDFEGWSDQKRILVILAHPDDPEFFCGGMIARWCRLKHDVRYCLLTKGQSGFPDPKVERSTIENTRIEEQRAAAKLLGVSDVHFMEYMDGSLVADLKLREEIIKYIRIIKPQVVVTCDPQNLFPFTDRINHPDHRAAGWAVLDAIFPAVNNELIKVLDDSGEPIEAHQVEELWVTLTNQENLLVDLTDYFELKIDALLCHRSQIHESREELAQRLRSRFSDDKGSGKFCYLEKYQRIKIAK